MWWWSDGPPINFPAYNNWSATLNASGYVLFFGGPIDVINFLFQVGLSKVYTITVIIQRVTSFKINQMPVSDPH